MSTDYVGDLGYRYCAILADLIYSRSRARLTHIDSKSVSLFCSCHDCAIERVHCFENNLNDQLLANIFCLIARFNLSLSKIKIRR